MTESEIKNILTNALTYYNKQISNILHSDVYGMEHCNACETAKDKCAEFIFKGISNFGVVTMLDISQDKIKIDINGKFYKVKKE